MRTPSTQKITPVAAGQFDENAESASTTDLASVQVSVLRLIPLGAEHSRAPLNRVAAMAEVEGRPVSVRVGRRP